MFLTYCTYCASDSGLSNVFVIALNIYCLCSACMSQSPSSAITILSPILTRRRARDKLDSAATCDGHCKNKSTLTDTSANFTDQPRPLSPPSVQPTSLVTFQATQRFPETTSPHFTLEFPSLSHKLSASDHESSPDPSQPFLSLETQIVSRKIISNGAIQLQWLARSQPSPVGNSGPSKNTTFPDNLKLK